MQAAQRAVLDRSEEIDVLLGLGIAVRKMDVRVDQARHHEVVGIVQHLVTGSSRRRLARRSDERKPTVVDDQGLIGPGRVRGRREKAFRT